MQDAQHKMVIILNIPKVKTWVKKCTHKQKYLISPPLPILKLHLVTYFVFKDFLTLTNMLKKLSALHAIKEKKKVLLSQRHEHFRSSFSFIFYRTPGKY